MGIEQQVSPGDVVRMAGWMQERMRELAQQSATASEAEQLAAFRERLAGKRGLRWKHFWCVVQSRLPSDPLPHEKAQWSDEQRELYLRRIPFERAASAEWREAHALPWTDFTLPVAQSAHDVAELAQRAGDETGEREADELTRALMQRPLSPPSDETMALADRVDQIAERLWRRVGKGGGQALPAETLVADRAPAPDKAPRGRRPRKGEKSEGYNLQALLLAKQHENKGEDWSITSIAAEIGVPRAALNRRTRKGGPYACASFMLYAKARGKSGKTVYHGEMGEKADRNAEGPADVPVPEDSDADL